MTHSAPAVAATSERDPGAGRAVVRAGLIWTLVRTDFKARYHGTIEGFVWALLKPLTMFVVLMSVFSFLFPNPAYKLNLIIGLFLWDFFAEGTKTGPRLASRERVSPDQSAMSFLDSGRDLDLQRADHARRVRRGSSGRS